LPPKKIIFTIIPLLSNEQQIGLLDLFHHLESKNHNILVWTADENALLTPYTKDVNEALKYKIVLKDKFSLIKLILYLNFKWFFRFKKWANISSFKVGKIAYFKKVLISFILLDRTKPDYFFCWNQMCPHFGIANEVARKLKIETRTIEWGILPNSFYFDIKGSFGFSQLHQITPKQTNSVIYKELGEKIYQNIKDKNLSVYSQKKEELEFLKNNNSRIILVLGIDESDSNIHPTWPDDRKIHLPFHRSCLDAALDISEQLNNYLVIYKPHPSRNKYTGILKKSDNLYIVNSDPNQLINLATAVVCFGSKMEINCILKDKPLLVFGGGLLANKGCATVINNKKNMKKFLEIALNSKLINDDKITNFKNYLGYFYEHNLYVVNDIYGNPNAKTQFIQNFTTNFFFSN
jgi:hypothetical protein